ncbi:TIM barrel protein [Paenibacillus sp. FSL H8-0537]|uniref:sugar phosphate isomerase/epimerase family protein n=1 Tax=Paenibacillus sp. FSL H8-0537 TaxID=2921399 RepID=UPI00310158E6
MRFGYRVRRYDLREPLVEKLVCNGFAHLEWDWRWSGDGYSPVPSVEELNYAKDICSQYGLSISIAGPNGISIAEKVVPLRKVSIGLWKEIYLASKFLEAKWLVLELGSAGFKSEDSAKKRERVSIAKDAIGDIIQNTEDGPLLLIENMRKLPEGSLKCYLGDDATDLLYCIDGLVDRCGLIFDTGHALIGENPEQCFNLLKSSIKAFHVHTNNRISDIHRALTREDISVNGDYWTSVINLIHLGVPAVLEIDSLSAALQTKQLITEYRS